MKDVLDIKNTKMQKINVSDYDQGTTLGTGKSFFKR